MSRPDPLDSDRRYTLADYLAWDDEGRWELMEGVPHAMVPAPTLDHQDVVMALGSHFRTLARNRLGGGGPGGGCHVLVAPVDVVLFPDTVVQPDVVVVCDPAKTANGRYVDGPPDLMVEVLSPATVLRDRRDKRRLYEAAGVSEYLLFDPVERYGEACHLGEDARYGPPTVMGPADPLATRLFGPEAPTLETLLGWPPEARELPAAYGG